MYKVLFKIIPCCCWLMVPEAKPTLLGYCSLYWNWYSENVCSPNTHLWGLPYSVTCVLTDDCITRHTFIWISFTSFIVSLNVCILCPIIIHWGFLELFNEKHFPVTTPFNLKYGLSFGLWSYYLRLNMFLKCIFNSASSSSIFSPLFQIE